MSAGDPRGRPPGEVLVSVVLPVFNERDVLRTLADALRGAVAEARCRGEFVFIDDGSTDGGSELLDDLACEDPAVRVVHFSRNFGHQAAVQAGLSLARGDVVVVMDSDLQDDPRSLKDFLHAWRLGADVVYAVRVGRKESAPKRLLFFAFYRLLNRISSVPLPADAGNFGLIDRKVARELVRLRDRDRYYAGLRGWVGFRQVGIPVERGPRYDGRPRVSVLGLFRLAKSAIFSFSKAPLTLFYAIGAISMAVFLGVAGFTLYHKLFTGLAIPGWTSGLLTTSLMGSLNALGIAVLGEYVTRIYDQVRGAPALRDRPDRQPGRRRRPRTVAVIAPLLLALAVGPTFEDFAPRSGIDFRYEMGSRGRFDLPEIMGGGVALFDADGDGLLDLSFANGGPIAPGPEGVDPPSPCRLYRNLGGMRFEDVTDRAGAPGPSYAMGFAVGDVDGDGRPDVLVTGWGGQRMYRNLGGMRFEDVTEAIGLESTGWSTSAAFADLDGDGDLDLYVARYLDYDAARSPYCAAPDGRRDYCGPADFPAQGDSLYRNDGGKFVDVSEGAGVRAAGSGRGLGILIAELTGDDRLDIFVANDGSPCWLLANRGELRFEEVGREAGVALDGSGEPLAGMGIALGDADGDGRDDLAVGNFYGRGTILFRGIGPGAYRDDSAASGLRAATRSVLGFGLALEDFDGDGGLDLLQANGHVLSRERLGEPFAMRPTLLANVGGMFREAPPQGWQDRPVLGRGLAVGDLDRDGRPDAVIGALDAPPILLRNTSDGGNILQVEPVAAGSPRSAIGARVRVEAGGRVLSRQLAAGGSYLSATPPTLSFGLGAARRADRVSVRWPSGREQEFGPLEVLAKPHRLAENSGAP
jgi:glycosyltransferase involved in cell wall biosynthesis